MTSDTKNIRTYVKLGMDTHLQSQSSCYEMGTEAEEPPDACRLSNLAYSGE